MDPVTDFIGTEIKPGSQLAYPVRRGSSMWLTKITVTQVTADEVKGYNSVGRRITVKNLKNTIVVSK